MIAPPDDPTGYELGPVPERVHPAQPPAAATPPPVALPRFGVRWRTLLIGAYVLALVSALYAYETSDAARARRLSRQHRERASAWHRAAFAARRVGHLNEASVFDDRSRQHDWFADAYRGIFRDRPRWYAAARGSEEPSP